MFVGRFGGQTRNALRRARKEAAAPPVEAGTYVEPPRDDCKIREYTAHEDATTRITVHVRNQASNLVYYAIMLDINDDGAWSHVARIDTSHGTAHIHRFTRQDQETGIRTVLMALHSESDVKLSWRDSYDTIKNNLAEHERHWRND